MGAGQPQADDAQLVRAPVVGGVHRLPDPLERLGGLVQPAEPQQVAEHRRDTGPAQQPLAHGRAQLAEVPGGGRGADPPGGPGAHRGDLGQGPLVGAELPGPVQALDGGVNVVVVQLLFGRLPEHVRGPRVLGVLHGEQVLGHQHRGRALVVQQLGDPPVQAGARGRGQRVQHDRAGRRVAEPTGGQQAALGERVDLPRHGVGVDVQQPPQQRR